MKICVVSDSHDRGDSLARCLAAGKAEGAIAALHCGDIIGTNTLRSSLAVGLPMHVIHGNNLGDAASLARLATKSAGQLNYYGQDADLTLHGRRVFIVHYPKYGHAMALTGDFDLVCCGHSHEASVTSVANVRNAHTWLINPGTTAGLGASRATWILADLEKMRFDIRPAPAPETA